MDNSEERLRKRKKKSMRKKLVLAWENSNVSSFSDIATSTSTVRQWFKLVIFVASTCGLLYQTYDFMKVYFSYLTVMNEAIEQPLFYTPPAITVCDNNVRSSSDVCSNFPSNCTYVSQEEMCKKKVKYCPLVITKEMKDVMFPIYNGNPICDEDCYSWNKTLAKKLNFDYLEHLSENSNYPDLPDFEVHPFTTKNGEPGSCYTLGLSRQRRKISQDPTDNTKVFGQFFYLHLDPLEILDPESMPSASMVLHDSRYPMNAYIHGFSLHAASHHVIYVTGVTEQTLLPAPYDTNCTDYESAWSKNNETGPLTQQQCLEECKFNTLVARKVKCMIRYLDYSHTMELCGKDEQVPSDVANFCKDQCGPACHQLIYHHRMKKVFQGREEGDLTQQIDKHSSLDYGQLNVMNLIKDFEITRITFKPKITPFEIFRNLGGYLGIWTGLSFLSFFDIARSLCHTALICHAHRQQKRKKNVTHTKVNLF